MSEKINFNPFIDVSDKQTGKINLSDVPESIIEEKYNKLTKEEKELVYMKINKYVSRPPSITQFYTDPYYLGGEDYFNQGTSLFDYWKGTLQEIFPDPFRSNYVYLSLSGSIGSGKSVCSRLIEAYTYYRLSCFKIYESWKLVPKPLTFLCVHSNVEVAEAEFVRWMKGVLLNSPAFQKLPLRHDIKLLASGPQSKLGIGTDLIFALLSEANFWPVQEKAVDKIRTLTLRMKSRFSDEQLRMAGQFIIDSSAKGDQDAQQVFLEEATPGSVLTVSPAHYEVRPNLYKKSGGKTFRIYKGDGSYSPMILPDGPINPDLDPDRVISVPIQCLGDAKADIIKFLQDVCGVSTRASNLFFNSDLSHLLTCMSGKNSIPDTFDVDFYDRNDRVMNYIEPQLRGIPKNAFLSVGLDIAIASDTAGISISSLSEWRDDNGTQVPVYKCHALFGLTRKEGQETSLFHIQQFLEDLNKEYKFMVCADQAYSKSIFQYCQREGIQTRYFSTDRNTDLGVYLKNTINREQIELPKSPRLHREVYDLQIVKRGQHMVIDHPAKAASLILDNIDGSKKPSKDFWDALSQSIYGLWMNITEGLEYGYSTTYQRQLGVIKNMTSSAKQSSAEVFQRIIENVF